MTGGDKKESKFALLVGIGAGVGVSLGLVILMIFFPGVLADPQYKLEMEKEYVAFHVDTTDFPMAAIDQMISVLKDNDVKAEAIVFVKNRKPVSQIRLSPPKTLWELEEEGLHVFDIKEKK